MLETGSHLINGTLVTGDEPPVIHPSPVDEEPYAACRFASKDQADRALDAAVAAAPDAEQLDIAARAHALRQLCERIEARADEIAAHLTMEIGCPARQSLHLQARTASALAAAYADLVKMHRFEERRPGLRGGDILLQKYPVGISVGIVPWNVPLFLLTVKLGAAIAAGCPIVLKTSPENPATGTVIAEILEGLDLPRGMVSIMTGGRDLGRHLVADARVQKVSFTGSTAAGRAVAAACAEQLIPCTLELGGKSAAILLDDMNIDAVKGELFLAMCQNNGQVCGAQSRLLVPRSHINQFTDQLQDLFENLVVGDPRDSRTDIGPLATPAQLKRSMHAVEQARQDGATIRTGGQAWPGATRGFYYEPTLITHVTNDMPVAREEIFGPVIAVIAYDNEDEAIAMANDSPYGLSGSVWSSDQDRALRVASRLKTGTVGLSTRRILDFGAPFGGVRASGLGRELGSEGIDAYLNVRTVIIP